MQSILQISRLHQQAAHTLRCAEDKRSSPILEHETPSEDDRREEVKGDTVEAGAARTSDDAFPIQAEKSIANFIPGVEVRQRTAAESISNNDGDGLVFVVRWEGPDDPMNPQKWPIPRRAVATMLVSLLAFAISAASSADAPVTSQSSTAYHVSEVPGSLTTGCYLMGIGVGSLFAGSFSETLGRNIVYAGAMLIFIVGGDTAALFGEFH